ncbi:hypothetical protein IWW47_005482, partial [Coemansia sp. RSA 2052]
YSETTDAHSAAGASAIVASAATGDGSGGAGLSAKTTAGVLLPLGQGVLETNLGIPLIVVCTKSDTMELIERERGFKEEDFDYIQQVLRAVCLQFGAALIYTSTHNPVTFSTLYHYLVHRLLTAPATMPALAAGSSQLPDTGDGLGEDNNEEMDSAAGDAGNRARSASAARDLSQGSKSAIEYPFRVRANVVDRDVVFVPSGWDSVTKISYLREPFDVYAVQDAWRVDEDRYQAIVDRATIAATAQPGATNGYQEESQRGHSGSSLLLMFGEAVAAPKQHSGMDADGGSTAAAVAMAAAGLASQVVVEDDQEFFERLFIEQQEQMALEGEEAGDSAPGIHASDSYADSGRPRVGGPANKLVASLMRGGHVAESSLSTASADADSIGDDLSDDGIDGHDTAVAPSSYSHAHARSESSDVGRGSLGRAATDYR